MKDPSAPMSSLIKKLEFDAVRHVVGDPSFSMTKLVDQLTNEGVWVDAFLELIDGTSRDYKHTFEDALRELGVDVPEYNDAIWTFVALHIYRISRDNIWISLGLLFDMFWHGDQKQAELMGFRELLLRYDDNNELHQIKASPEALAGLDKAIVQSAERWLRVILPAYKQWKTQTQLAGGSGDSAEIRFCRTDMPLNIEPGSEDSTFKKMVACISGCQTNNIDLSRLINCDGYALDIVAILECILIAEEIWHVRILPEPYTFYDVTQASKLFGNLESIMLHAQHLVSTGY